jgi:hypothetical protein
MFIKLFLMADVIKQKLTKLPTFSRV